MFWQALEQLRCWERDNLPGADTAVGNEVLVWLLKSKNQPRPLKDLYQSSRFSEPTIRNCLKQFSSLGFAIIESNGKDQRARYDEERRTNADDTSDRHDGRQITRRNRRTPQQSRRLVAMLREIAASLSSMAHGA
mgnify:CR=1 FL=1